MDQSVELAITTISNALAQTEKEMSALREENAMLKMRVAEMEVKERLDRLLSECKDIANTATMMFEANKRLDKRIAEYVANNIEGE